MFVDRHSLLLPKAHFPSLEVTPPQVLSCCFLSLEIFSRSKCSQTHQRVTLLGNTTHLHIDKFMFEQLVLSMSFGLICR